MRLFRLIIGGVGALLLLGAVGVAANIALSLDWERTHRRETAALPFYEQGMPDGLYQLRANGLVFRARLYGAGNDGPGVILLHGHPETSIMWETLGRAAAKAGYRVIAFDQRGYSPAARPKGVAPYRADHQIADVIAVADVLGFGRFHLVGHDWGAIIAWATTIFHDDRIFTLTTLSLPHPATLNKMVVDETPAYIRLFSLPWLPEATLLFDDLAGYRKFYTAQSGAEIAEYLKVFSEPGAATATLNWYRSIRASVSLVEAQDAAISTPTLFIYGDEEFWVTPEFLAEQRNLMRGPYREIELAAAHWLMQPHAATITEAVLNQFASAEESPQGDQ